jgi:hypothetical protein
LAFGALEFTVRLTRPYYDLLGMTGRGPDFHPHELWAEGDAFCSFRARPGVYGGEYGNPDKTVNRYGFISTPDLLLDKPTNTLRIAFIGGSSTAGTGVDLPDRETWPWKVAARLRKAYTNQNIEFINAAVGGYCSFESYGRLWSRVRFFSPDILVVYHGWNEMFYFNSGTNIVNWRPNNGWPFTKSRPAPWLKPRAVDRWIAWSQVLTRIRIRLWPPASGQLGDSREDGKDRPLANEFDRRGLDVWRFNLCLIREAARLMNAELFVCKQATLAAPNASPEAQARVQYHHHGFNHAAHVRAFSDIYRIIEEEIPREYIIDATPLSGDITLLHDCVHPTFAGTDRLADIVANHLLSVSTCLRR